MYVGSSNGYAVPVYKTSDTVFVHGHEQCSKCGSVVHDCCQGERA